MRLLDLFSGAGGAAMGYHRAGFDVVGVDDRPQPHYPFEFHQADAMTFPLEGFDVVHASPPCQLFSAYRRRGDGVGSTYLNLIPGIRDRLREWGGPYVIENIPRTPLVDPIQLCGSSFRLDVRRHRLFESNLDLTAPGCDHGWQTPRFTPASNRTNLRSTVEIGVYRIPLNVQQQAMEIDWMTLSELSQAVPPAYTEHLGRQITRLPHRLTPGRRPASLNPVKGTTHLMTKILRPSGIIAAAVFTSVLAFAAPASAADITGTNQADTLIGTVNDDDIRGLAGPDDITGRGGNDWISSGVGNDSSAGNFGYDDVNGGLGNDDLTGGLDNDYVSGQRGNDFASGGGGYDEVRGGSSPDIISGGEESDEMYPGPGADSSFAGNANDYTEVAVDGAADWIDCGDGEDEVGLIDNQLDPLDNFVGCENFVAVV